jgi:ribosomal protein S18 acetylase RimI-like enzyme
VKQETIEIRPKADADQAFVQSELVKHWCTTTIWSVDRRYEADQLPAFIAWLDGHRVGHITLGFDPGECEVVTLSATVEGKGIATMLLDAAAVEARQRGAKRLRLTTTNDNLRALAMYQKRGWKLIALHKGMIDRYRERVPAIPLIGLNGIPLHDEIELELPLGPT